MMNGTVEHAVKKSMLYSYVLAQPLAAYVDASPVFQTKVLLESEQLQYGKHGESVRILQQKLNKLSYYDDELDGVYDILTEHALKKFQAEHNVTINGQADKETLYALVKIERKQYLNQIENLSESVYPGMHSEDVKIVQNALAYFGYYEGEIDGIYGPKTKEALEITEEKHGIEMTEEITQDTLTQLYDTTTQEEETAETEEATNTSEEVESVEETEPNEEAESNEAVESTEEVEKENQEVQKEEIKKVEVEGANAGAVQVARSLIGTPYVWGGESPNGFDCSGFIQYIFQRQDISIPRTVSETWNFAQPVDAPSIGDLVFFETYQPGPSHMGIYIGDGQFIHAGESNGVEISELKSSYWEPKYLGSKRISE